MTDKFTGNLNGRIIAQRIALEQEQELREMKAVGILYLLKVKVPRMHPYRNFNFETVINPYKSFDALKKFGGKHIHDCDWRIESIDGTLIANGNGSDEFNTFFDSIDSELAKLKVKVIEARKALEEKKELLRHAQLEAQIAFDSYEAAKRELNLLKAVQY